MLLVLIKFVEVFTRAAFVVGTSYSLNLAGAGQFGIVATLVGLGAFAFNWERQVDIQRRHAGGAPERFDRAVAEALPFWGFNQIVMLPLFALAAWAMAHLSAVQLALAVAIVSAEHVANQTYQMALINPRYARFLMLAAAKNIAVLAAVLPYILFAPSALTLDYVLVVWAAGQLLCAAAVLALWRGMAKPAPREGEQGAWARITAQHRASFTHFQIGLVAILMLQYDRLVVGALLPLDQAGVYFRHVLIVSFVYQFFNTASYNRIMPRIFAAAKTETNGALAARMRPEILGMYALVIAGFGAAVLIDVATGRAISAKYHLSVPLAAVLTLAALLRIVADYAGMIANARHREDLILRYQLAAFLAGAALLAVLALRFGVAGAAAATLAASALYLFLIVRAVRALPAKAPA